MAYHKEYETKRTSLKLVLLSFFNRVFLAILAFFSASVRTGPFWRLCSRFLFLEMKTLHKSGVWSSRPYIQFERHLAGSPEHLERFQNFVAGNGILTDLLATNYFEFLPIRERVPVTSLFRRIYKKENVWLSYRNRPMSVDRIDTLENVDQDSLPDLVFLVPVRSTGGVMKAGLKVFGFINAIFSMVISQIRTIISALGTLASHIALTIVGIPILLISILGATSPKIQGWGIRKRLLQFSLFRPGSKKIPNLLSRYETLYAKDSESLEKMSKILKKPIFREFLTKTNLDELAFNDRVLITSLLRRCAASDPEFATLVKASNITQDISVRSQHHVAQLTRPGRQQKSEWKIFKKVQSNQKQITRKKFSTSESSDAPEKSGPLPVPLSEVILKQDGWFDPLQKFDLEFSTALRERAYSDAIEFVNKAENFAGLSFEMKTKAAAFMALMQKPFTYDVTKVEPELDTALLIPTIIGNREKKTRAKKAHSIALDFLNPQYEGDAARSPMACWKSLEDSLSDDTKFSYAAEVLTSSYSGTPFNRITSRSVSFDTFMIMRVEEVLDKIRLWVDWDYCPNSALTAYAYAAASVGDRANFDFFIATLDGRIGIAPRFVINLRDSFFNNGIHQLDAVLLSKTAKAQTSQLTTIGKKKKFLCLVEKGAKLQSLRQIQGINKNLLCAPVATVDALSFPPDATLIQAEDFIPLYSKEDMEIGTEIDSLTEHFLNAAREKIKSAGLSELYEDAIEVTHGTMFSALYRDAISARVCEKLVKTAKEYDGVILLPRTGQILGNMIKPAIEAVGQENVYLSLGSNRTQDYFSLLTTMRAAAKAVKPKKSTVKIENADTRKWMSSLSGWISDIMNFHYRSTQAATTEPYSIMTLEHINGYYDSYEALLQEGLPHSNVELFTSATNFQLNEHIVEGGFAPYEKPYSLKHCEMRPRTPDARAWLTPFVEELRGSFEGVESSFLPQYHDMILDRTMSVFAQRLPQIMDAVSYFRARFTKGLPDYIFTGPNQHMISRSAAYCGKAAGVPVYDFLILANTNHPRYRPIIANYAYLYDPWYKEIYQSFFGMKEDQLRTAGPLFEYSARLTQKPREDYAAPRGKTHIVMFSQSANFNSSKLMLESICQATKDRKDIYITVKLHPHESPANIELYTQIAADNGIIKNLHVFHMGDAVSLLNQADLVIQSFSNIGLDALLLKKPVITFKPKIDLKARIFLYEKDIGYVVSTKKTLTNKIKKFLTDPSDRETMQVIAEKFAAENDHFLRGQNAARVMKSVQEDVIRYKAARKN